MEFKSLMKTSQLIEITTATERAMTSGIIVSNTRFKTTDRSLLHLLVLQQAIGMQELDDESVFVVESDAGLMEVTSAQVDALLYYSALHLAGCYERKLELLTQAAAGEPYRILEDWPEVIVEDDYDENGTEEDYITEDEEEETPETPLDLSGKLLDSGTQVEEYNPEPLDSPVVVPKPVKTRKPKPE
jgi:hypothetical protein